MASIPLEQMPEITKPQPSRVLVILRNMLSLLGSDIANRASSFALYILIARYLGEFSMGQMALAQQTFFFIGYSLAGLGMRWFMAREIPKDPSKTERYLVNGLAMVLSASVVVWIAYIFITMASGYIDETRNAIMLMAITIFPYTMIMVLEGVFVGREKMHFIVLVNAPMNLLNIIAVFLVLNNGGSLTQVILVQVASYSLIALIEIFFMVRYVARPRELPNFNFMHSLFRAVGSIYAIDAITAIRAMLSVYLISLVATEATVGLFSSAMQLYVPAILPITSVIGSLLPMLVRQIEPGMQKFKASAKNVIEIISWISIPASTGLFIAAPGILVLFYGRESYAEAAIYLRIVAFALVMDGVTKLLGAMLYATSNEKQNLRIVLVFSAITLVGAVVGIGLYGAIGAAVLSLVFTTAELIVHIVVIARVLKLRFNFVPLMARATVSSAIMALALLFPLAGLPTIFQIIGAAVVYGVTLVGGLLLTVGGPNKIKEHYLKRDRDETPEPAAVSLAPLAEPD